MYKNYQHCQKQLDGIESIDFYLARQLCKALSREQDELLFHSIMATSQALRNGHTCLKLNEDSPEESESLYWHNQDEGKSGYLFPILEEWHQHLHAIELIPDAKHPLVYEDHRLYLRRYWQFENELGCAVSELINDQLISSSAFNMEQARDIIDGLFPKTKINPSDELDWQKIAVANALIKRFTIIAGGPGTGKTFTVTKVLTALQSLYGNTLNIAMVAPTGKAAQRLNESIQKAKSFLRQDKLAAQETLDSIPDTASTLHRLLGVIPGSHNFRFHEKKPLSFDVILVDEVSMIDLPLMSRLIRALKENCRIIMLGDADQLPSVAAGSVLADLALQQIPAYGKDSSEKLSLLTGFKIPVLQEDKNSINLDHLTVLQKSHRFDGVGEIGQLARLVIKGQDLKSWDYLQQAREQIKQVDNEFFKQWIEQMTEQYYVPLLENSSGSYNDFNSQILMDTFQKLTQFRLLAATRLGEQGIDRINEIVELTLSNKGLIPSGSEFYPGRPIMVTENNYNVGLYNGDTGLLWNNNQGKLQAVFQESESLKWLSLGRLPKVETVYAMTIHKTQGSEFAHVALVLPEKDSLILSRELLYTGITRASKQLSVWAEETVWTIGVKRKVQRNSGLTQRVFRA
ncbi:MAG: exodeoxyribonuclease V subunit alpha [Gammaproteobacteria bacterium]|nr:exodeoxyribonuclease V subunit alpha [Gammaproteobacteria bacterium]